MNLKIIEKCDVFEENVFNFFQYKKIIDRKFNIIFVDPPFKEKKINLLIEEILEKKILNNNGIMIIHRHKKDDIIISNKLRILDTRAYGISKIIIGR